jgi:hypothetical protein
MHGIEATSRPKRREDMASSRTNGLMVGATLLGGLLAGMAANKVLVELPAWQAVGVVQWANFTRTSDHGLGLTLFPFIGGGALILTVAAAIAIYLDRAAPRSRGGTRLSGADPGDRRPARHDLPARATKTQFDAGGR